MIPRNAIQRSFAIVVLSASLFPLLAQANTYPETPEDFAKLPPFCTARHQGLNTHPPARTQFGEVCWIHLHHYCLGLHQVNYALAETDAQKRESHIKTALEGGFDYMWKSAGTQCVLMPQIMVDRGKAVLLVKRYSEAVDSFRKAIDLNPRYIPAYLEMASLYTKSGQTDAARTILDHALKIDPTSHPVQRQLDRLNGKPPEKSHSKK